jgi:hypothetical protein
MYCVGWLYFIVDIFTNVVIISPGIAFEVCFKKIPDDITGLNA